MRTVLGAVGRVLVTLGLLLLLFVAYQLWGTGIYQARAQNDLEEQFNESLEAPRRRHDAIARRTAIGPCRGGDDHARAAHRAPPGRRGRPDRDPDDRGRPVRRRRRRRRRPAQGARALPEHATSRARGQQRNRRPPHDLRRAVRRSRPGRTGRRDQRDHGAGPVRVHGDRAARRRPGRDQRARPVTGSGALGSPTGHPHPDHLQPPVLSRDAVSSSARWLELPAGESVPLPPTRTA